MKWTRPKACSSTYLILRAKKLPYRAKTFIFSIPGKKTFCPPPKDLLFVFLHGCKTRRLLDILGLRPYFETSCSLEWGLLGRFTSESFGFCLFAQENAKKLSSGVRDKEKRYQSKLLGCKKRFMSFPFFVLFNY